MALNGVFANELQFASTCEQTETDEREKDTASNADLEEGEIEDDEEEQQVEDKPSAPSKEENETGNKEDVSRPTNESSDNKSGEKPRDRRQSSNSSSNNSTSRSKRSRAASHERDSQRKRRKTLENDSFGENAGPEARGASPSRPYHRESGGSDLDDNATSSSPRRRAAHDRRSRSGRGSPGRRRRGSSRERNDRRRDRSDRDRRPAKPSGPPPARVKDDSICAFFMEGKCSRGSDCPYSHAALPPRKMELCKFYLMDCCAKKEKCLYLHKDFPCKFFHTGRKCRYTAESCKFSHDRLSDTMRAILVKHIETAPREILGDFPRLTREETIHAIDNFSNPSSQSESRPVIPSLFESNKTQDSVREPIDSSITPQEPENQPSPRFGSRPSFYEEVAIGHGSEEAKDVKQSEENSRSIWFGTLASNETKSESPAEPVKTEPFRSPAYDEDFRQPPVHSLPARQRLLYRRIQQQQREPLTTGQDSSLVKEERAANEKWYSSDEEEEVDKSLANLAKSIHGEGDPRRDISGSPFVNADSTREMNAVDVAKALSSYPPLQKTDGSNEAPTKRDPRIRDPRKRSADVSASDVDLRTFAPVSSRLDVDLRFESRLDSDFRTPYAGRMDEMKRPDFGYRGMEPMMQRHMFQEIDASTANNPPIRYQLYPVDVEPIDYGVIKVQADWAHLDPRQQKNWASYRNVSTGDAASNTYYSPASPEPPSGPPTSMLSRPYDSYVPAAHSDPRQRDPRGMPLDTRGPSGFPVIPHHHISEQEPFSPTYMPHHRSYPTEHGVDVSRDMHRPVENRRDPRQRFRNQT